MRKVLVFAFFLFLFGKSWASPTSLYWTTCNTDVVPTCDVLLGISDYFTVFNRDGRGQIFPTDVGLTWGIFTCGKWAAEAGIDYFGSLGHPWFFNAKIRLEENAYARGAPSFAVGVFDIGTGGRTPRYVFDIIFGKTFRDKSRLFVGAYGGKNIGKQPAGFMVGYLKGFCYMTDCEGREFPKWTFLADWATGHNEIGGGGFGFQYAFNARIAIISGPTWFLDSRINGKWKWTIQSFFLIPLKRTSSSTKAKDQVEKKTSSTTTSSQSSSVPPASSSSQSSSTGQSTPREAVPQQPRPTTSHAPSIPPASGPKTQKAP